MQIHASCAARTGEAVLLLGPSGSGKSDLILRLLARGFELVADDRVDIENGLARPPLALAGLLEVRGLGLIRLPYRAPARLRLAVEMAREFSGDAGRLPNPVRHEELDVPLIRLDPFHASAPQRVELALDCALGRLGMVAGAFEGQPARDDAEAAQPVVLQ